MPCPRTAPQSPPHAWELDNDGHRGAQSLRDVLPPGAMLVSSMEPKARQTLEASGRGIIDARFGEVKRDEPFGDEFRTRRLAYVTGTDHPGWEPARTSSPDRVLCVHGRSRRRTIVCCGQKRPRGGRCGHR